MCDLAYGNNGSGCNNHGGSDGDGKEKEDDNDKYGGYNHGGSDGDGNKKEDNDNYGDDDGSEDHDDNDDVGQNNVDIKINEDNVHCDITSTLKMISNIINTVKGIKF